MSPLFFCWPCVLLLDAVVGNPLAGLAGPLDQHAAQDLWIVETEPDQLEERVRVKRQVGNYGNDPGSQVINDIFQIPILTLTAVSNLFRSTRAQRNQRRRQTTNNNNNNNNLDNNNNNNADDSTAYNAGYNAYNSKPSAYYTTDSAGQNNGYSDVYSRPNRYTSSNGYNRPNNYYNQQLSGNRYSRHSAASIARLTVAKDGSSFKI